ncbi:hypothetical protein [Sinorhizobium meliloti]|uniref:hypothetical protein n=1 Tax=Rhizobium meliloti TaxID=382 RepID=UPI0002E181F9|nr:hypothetical protein [Sinorhizobium meliloti]MDE3767575.1 hypothetical protein [Sinorhizobium meliloti]MDE3779795.1 hypothetical protein [Sinorhizobium meliloti]MDE3807420.1 hypothetical protein [Sinorhizobium meliloti]
MRRAIKTHNIVWRGIAIEITYEAQWLGSDGPYSMAHLAITALAPERAALPITETGYRSHFANAEDIEADGGPVAFVTAWLDHAAESKGWKDSQEKARQLSLF